MTRKAATRDEKIQAIVRSILEQRFDDIEIVRINVNDEVDEDGDLVIRVRVVFDAKEKHLDASRVSGLVREALPQLAKVQERGFPVFSFIAKSELGKLSPEAA